MKLNLGALRCGSQSWPRLQILTGDHALVDMPGLVALITLNRRKGGVVYRQTWAVTSPAVVKQHVYEREPSPRALGVDGAPSRMGRKLVWFKGGRWGALQTYERGTGRPVSRWFSDHQLAPSWAYRLNP